jgi:hypothetical protein
MADPYGLHGIDLRHERAGEHLAYVNQAVKVFREGNPYPILPYEETDVLPQPPLWRMHEDLDRLGASGFEVTRDIRLNPRIGIRVGEMFYNLRAAMDHLIFALAWHDTGSRPAGDHERLLQFPLDDSPKVFEGRRHTMLKGLREDHIALVKRYQPYKGCDWSRTLRDFSNSDKHRQVTMLAGAFNTYEGEYFVSLSEIPEAIRERARAASPDEMDVGLYATLDVTLMDGSPLAETLQELQTQIGQLLLRFRREFEFPPTD